MNQTHHTKRIGILFLLSTGLSFASLAQSATDADSTNLTTKEFVFVGKTAQFPGGMAKFYQYLGKNIRYPKNAKKSRIEGRIYVSFVINADGSIEKTSVRALEKDEMLPSMTNAVFHPELQEEAVRLLRECPDWKPGLSKNKPVRQKMIVPVMFKL